MKYIKLLSVFITNDSSESCFFRPLFFLYPRLFLELCNHRNYEFAVNIPFEIKEFPFHEQVLVGTGHKCIPSVLAGLKLYRSTVVALWWWERNHFKLENFIRFYLLKLTSFCNKLIMVLKDKKIIYIIYIIDIDIIIYIL